MSRGTLIVRPKSATLARKTNVLGEMDPYVNLTIGGNTQKTSVANNAGKTPTWNDELRFTISGESMMNFQIFDKDKLSRDDLICEGSFQLQQVFSSRNRTESIPCTFKGSNIGVLVVEFSFLPLNINQNGPGIPGQGFPGQGFPGQGFPGQGFPEQGFPGQGFPQGYNNGHR